MYFNFKITCFIKYTLFVLFFLLLFHTLSYANSEILQLNQVINNYLKNLIINYNLLLNYIPNLNKDNFYFNVKFIESPRIIKSKNNKVLFEIPLITNEYIARFIYLLPNNKIIFPIGTPAINARYFLTNREWNEVKNEEIKLPYFLDDSIELDFNITPFPFVIHNKQNEFTELSGLIVNKSNINKFNVIDYIQYLPQKYIQNYDFKQNSLSKSIKFYPLKSFSYAASWCADWWQIISCSSNEVIFEKYIDYISKTKAFGLNPKILELIYYERAKTEKEFFTFSTILKDYVFLNEPVASSLEAYASILVLPEIYNIKDTEKNIEFKINPKLKFNLDDEYIEIFNNFSLNSEVLITALNTHGIVLAGIPIYIKGIPINHSSKAVVILGYKNLGNLTLFLYKDFEDPIEVYRIAPITLFKEAYCFIKTFTAKVKYSIKQRKIILETFDKNGNYIDVDIINATFPNETKKINFLKEYIGIYSYQVSKEEMSNFAKPTLNANIKKKYFVDKNGNEFLNIKFAIY